MSKQFLQSKIDSLLCLDEVIEALNTEKEFRTYNQNQLVLRVELLQIKINQ